MKNALLISTILCLFASSCFYPNIRKNLDQAESLLQTRPDSSLAIMESVDVSDLSTCKDKARYALLMSAALDKNYIDISSDSLIQLSVDFYSKSTDSLHRMMSYFYLGTVYSNAKEYTKAIIALEKAEKDAVAINDHFYSGLISRTKALVFSNTNNNAAAIMAMQNAVDHFSYIVNRPIYADHARLSLAICYINNKDYDLAAKELASLQDSNDLFLMESCKIMSAVIAVDSRKDMDKAVALFSSAQKDLLGINETGLFAIALENTGQKDSTDLRITDAYAMCADQADSATVDFMHAEILHLRGNDSEAYRLTRKAAFVQDSLTRVLLQQSVSNAQRDYYKAESQLQEERAKRLRERNRLGAAAALLALALLSGATLSYRKRKEQEIKEQMLNLSIAQAELRQAEQTNASLLGSLFSEKLHHLDMISEDYVRADSDKERIAALREFKEEIAAMRTDKDLFASLEKDLDRYCDGVMSKLRKQVTSIKGENLKLITLFFAGLPYSTVQLVMNRVSIESLKMARSRFRKEIKAANAPDEALFIKLLEMKSNRSVRQDK